jgi:hypothetical protein
VRQALVSCPGRFAAQLGRAAGMGLMQRRFRTIPCISAEDGLTRSPAMSVFRSAMVAMVLLPAAAVAQFLPDNADWWWLHTDDEVAHFVVEIGPNDDTAPTWLVLHGGFGAEHSYLIEVVLPHSGQHRFILYDQRGSLRSPAPEQGVTFDRWTSISSV